MEEKKIKTNYRKGRYSYPVCNGEGREGWYMKLPSGIGETADSMYKRLVEAGYTRIAFYEVTTRVRGLHEIIAYVK